MYPVSTLFEQYMVQSDRQFEIKAVVGLTAYDNTSVIEFDIEDSVIPSEEFTLGTVISSRLTISIRTADTIPTNAKVSPFVRLNGISGYTEWAPLGSYYIDSRTYQNNVWKFTCFDKLILSQQPYVSNLVYPISMALVFEELCSQLDYDIDPSLVINPAYMIPYKDEDITMREMFGYIASAHAASVRLTKDELLTFVKYLPGAPQTNILASDYFKANETNPLKTYTALKLTYNTDGETLTAGSGDSDHTLSIYNPFMDQGILDTVMATVNGFSYMPFTMEWKGRPDLEIGDSVTVTRRDGSTFPSIILTNKVSYKGGLKTTSTAPSYSPQRSETDYKGSIKQQIVAAARSGIIPDEPYYGVTLGRLHGLKIERSDGISKATFNSDLLEIRRNGSPVFEVNELGKVELTDIVIHGGTITWGEGGANVPTAGQIGAETPSGAQAKVDTAFADIANQIVFKVEIISSNGNVFKNGQIETTLSAFVYHGANDVTSTIDANRFRWTRYSLDVDGDAIWNASNFGGTKQIVVTPSDISVRACFNCTILDINLT